MKIETEDVEETEASAELVRLSDGGQPLPHQSREAREVPNVPV
jgi:hypothetical protein